jgi:hypothetical protein
MVLISAHEPAIIKSFAGGAAYTLENAETNVSVLFQGDDAVKFEVEWQTACENFGYARAARLMLDQHEHVMTRV